MNTKTQTTVQAHTIRRCFMTGKQCIYCDRFRNEQANTSKSAFIAMPYRPNIETCFDWSIKPFLKDQLNLADDEIKRADDFSNIGAITCQKICRPIQESEYVVVDISIPNANVIYELGLAWGLGKKVLLLADEGCYDKPNTYAQKVVEFLGVMEKILKYKSSGLLKLEKEGDSIENYFCQPIAGTGKKCEGVAVIGFAGTDEEGKNQPLTNSDDIHIPFNRLLDSVVGVAEKRITDTKSETNEEMRKASDILNDKARTGTQIGFAEYPDKPLKNTEGNHIRFFPSNFLDVSNAVDTAFCCIIDLMSEAPQPYFWLGYCHSKGINAIPIYRKVNTNISDNILLQPCDIETKKGNDNQESIGHTPTPRQKILAFDIRALWYIDFDKLKEKKDLANLLHSVFVELINRDLPRRQRNVFWGNLSKSGEIHIFTGAIHIDELNRKMVGDWDQRTVSELVRYLSAADSSVRPILSEPIYDPENAIGEKPNKKQRVPLETREKYFDSVKAVLKDKNCVLVASADVNALTEILLAYAYNPKYIDEGPSDKVETEVKEYIFGEKSYDNEEQMVVALKHPPAKVDTEKVVIRMFSRPKKQNERILKANRGFKIGSHVVSSPYHSSEDLEEGDSFTLLSHILIMPNPFSHDKHIVILNGVSGPGTFALAEVLTGGVKKDKEEFDKEKTSENMLGKINGLWKDNFKLIQGIVSATIAKNKKDKSQTLSLYDDRDVVRWEWTEHSNAQSVGNQLCVRGKSLNPWSR